EMYYYIDLVRILTGKDPDLIKGLDNLRRHVLKTKPKGFYCVAEVSQNLLYHIHSIIIYDDKELFDKAMIYLRLHRLRNKVDDIRQLNTCTDADSYYKYINKQFKTADDRHLRSNYIFKSFEDFNNFDGIFKINYLKNTIETDIFLPD
uniref:hypothetical protein n=2 Tax=Pseudomonadati TaxID=3379134 RepID=UPI004047894A